MKALVATVETTSLFSSCSQRSRRVNNQEASNAPTLKIASVNLFSKLGLGFGALQKDSAVDGASDGHAAPALLHQAAQPLLVLTHKSKAHTYTSDQADMLNSSVIFKRANVCVLVRRLTSGTMS